MRRRLPLLLALVAPAGPAAANPCTPSRLLLVVDKSSSMNDKLANTQTSKWQAAQQAVGQIAMSYDKKLDLGLMLFPSPSECSPGKVLLDPLPGNGSKIAAAMMGAPPESGNWTPMAQSVDAAAAHPSLADPKRNPSILLVTDGWQWCSPYDPATRFWPVASVKKARALGIKVYVVGFGSAVDVLTLNRMAQESGTALAGCDPNGADLASPNKCYYQADNLPALQAALNLVALKVSAEVCDGLDNDCNGMVDEGMVRSCMTACGMGMEQCEMGAWVGCDAPAPQKELCDGRDNDCNGAADEGCDCVAGQTRPCGVQKGACTQGVQTCDANGRWQAECVGGTRPGAEECNGVDDDCNGTVDDPSPSLCPMGASCVEGTCREDPLPRPDPGEGFAAEPGGCGCSLGGRAPAVGASALLLAMAWCLAWLLRRRA